MTSIEVGRPYGSDSGRIGRGFLKFDLTGITPTIFANMTKAELVLKIGFALSVSPASNDTVKISRTSVTDVPQGNNPLSTTYTSLGNSSNILINNAYLMPNANSISVSIDNQTIRDHRTYNTPLSIALMHKNEINRGIIIKEAKLVITYKAAATSPPAAPTNVKATPTPNGCQLTWNASSGATQYEVYNGNTKLTTVSTTSATISGLNPLTNYTLCVKAINAVGPSGCTNVSFKTTHNVTISGYTSICYGSARSFSVNNAPAGFTWSNSSNLSLSSTTSTSITVSAANSSSQGEGWVKIHYGGAEVKKYDVWVGAPSITVSGPTSATLGSGKSYQAVLANNYSGPAVTGYEWEINPTSGRVFNYGNTATIYFNAATSYMVRCRAQNSCGYGPWAHIYVNVNRSASPVYPNPVDDILYVEVGSNADPNARNAAPAYDIRLYDGRGIQVLQKSANGGTIQLDVSRLPDGIYYLHIYDGVSSTPEMHQIIVKH